MRKTKPSKQKRKFRLLLDAAFAKTDQFPKLQKKANVAHIVHDLNLSYQAEDKDIYQKAVETDRFVVTINFNDFTKLVVKGKPGIIGIPSQLTNTEIDILLTEFVTSNTVASCTGKAIKV